MPKEVFGSLSFCLVLGVPWETVPVENSVVFCYSRFTSKEGNWKLDFCPDIYGFYFLSSAKIMMFLVEEEWEDVSWVSELGAGWKSGSCFHICFSLTSGESKDSGGVETFNMHTILHVWKTS